MDLLYNDPEMSNYLPKTTAQDIFFAKQGKYSEDRGYSRPAGEVDLESQRFDSSKPKPQEADLESQRFDRKNAPTENTGVFKKEVPPPAADLESQRFDKKK